MPRRKPFRLPERIVTLFFEDGPYEGFEVDVSLTAPNALFWRIAEALDDVDKPADEAQTLDDLKANITRDRETNLLFGQQIRSWNLTGQDGAPIPATPEAFAERLDSRTQGLLIGRWIDAVRNPPASLSPGPRKRRTSARK